MPIDLPYFDVLLDRLEQNHPELTTAFGRHVHWGYWGNADRADGSMTNFAQAAERMTRRVLACAGIENGQRVLDVGSGFGGTVASLNEQFDDVSLTGLNIDARQIARARRRVRPRSGNVIQFREGDACQMPFDDDSFDTVIALECAFHFPSRLRFLAEAHRVLRPGGRLAVADFVPTRWLVPFLKAQGLVLGGYVKHVLGPADVSFTIERYRQTAKEQGLLLAATDDITEGTLPTYPVLRKVAVEMNLHQRTARFGVNTLEWASRAKLLRYVILTFEKEVSRVEAEPVQEPLSGAV
ncbi:MAG TPA: methyltransferase domain-containing protein [Polyangiaceae bacterium]|nr:methyltransferase domain-containing protein [Polyangiaceae bacterium]